MRLPGDAGAVGPIAIEPTPNRMLTPNHMPRKLSTRRLRSDATATAPAPWRRHPHRPADEENCLHEGTNRTAAAMVPDTEAERRSSVDRVLVGQQIAQARRPPLSPP